ncbi:hypothetical protein EC178850_4820 [Escherichia coli 178850]|nr:hypothetical protein EC178850_4820 [Escherichia coli 178850]
MLPDTNGFLTMPIILMSLNVSMGLKKGFCQQLHPQSLVQARELEIQ